MSDSRLHEIHHSVKFKRAPGIELRVIETASRHDASWKKPLIPHVMDREDRSRVRKRVVGPVDPLQIRGYQSALMIVAVENVRRSILEKFHDRALKKNPAICLIGIIP